MTEFYADTYAILAFLKGDERYGRRFRAGSFRTGILNLLEAHDAHHRFEVSSEEIERNLAPFEEAVLGLDPDLVSAAARLRAELRPRRLTLADAVALAQARLEELPLLTGDGRFRDLPGVEFLEAGRARRRP